MEELTKTEERIMQIIWGFKKVFVKDIIEQLDENPKPPYTTISSVVRILENKGFVGHTAYGKTHEYFPLISKNEYRKSHFKNMVKNYFDGEMENVLSFILKEKKLTQEELNNLKRWIDNQ
jgi:predicted transcriptional regulator